MENIVKLDNFCETANDNEKIYLEFIRKKSDVVGKVLFEEIQEFAEQFKFDGPKIIYFVLSDLYFSAYQHFLDSTEITDQSVGKNVKDVCDEQLLAGLELLFDGLTADTRNKVVELAQGNLTMKNKENKK